MWEQGSEPSCFTFLFQSHLRKDIASGIETQATLSQYTYHLLSLKGILGSRVQVLDFIKDNKLQEHILAAWLSVHIASRWWSRHYWGNIWHRNMEIQCLSNALYVGRAFSVSQASITISWLMRAGDLYVLFVIQSSIRSLIWSLTWIKSTSSHSALHVHRHST